MSKLNLETVRQAQAQPVTTNHRLFYYQPKVYYLGSVDKVEANYSGSAVDGPDNGYYYDR